MPQVIKKDNNRFRIVCSLGYADGRQIRKTTTFKAPEGTTPKKLKNLQMNLLSILNEKFKEMLQLLIICDFRNYVSSILLYMPQIN